MTVACYGTIVRGSLRRTLTAPAARVASLEAVYASRPLAEFPNCASADQGAANVTMEADEAPLEGLGEFLRQRGLERHLAAAAAWCRESGAAFLDEVREHLGELADALGLDGEDRRRLLEEAVAVKVAAPPPALVEQPAPAPSSLATAPVRALVGGKTLSVGLAPQPRMLHAGSIDRTTTAPMTLAETQEAQARAAKAYVPLSAWADTRISAVPAAQCTVGAGADALQRSASAEANALPGPDMAPQSRRQGIRENPSFYRMRQWSPPRYRLQSAWDRRTLTARIPSPAELGALAEAQKRLAESMASPKPVGMDAKWQGSAVTDRVTSFPQLQQAFLQQHGNKIRDELPGVRLEPAQVGPEVQRRFLKECGEEVPLPTYHGTKEENFPSIMSRGLIIPGKHGVTVTHGSAHGLGVYTASLGNAWLSKFFCDSDSFLVCGVAEEKATPTAAPTAAPAAAASSLGQVQKGPHFHRSHHRPVAASVAGAPKTMGHLQVHKETPNIRHVGGAVVVFDEKKVAPLFVAQGICRNTETDYSKASFLNPGNQHGFLPGGGSKVASRQAKVGEELIWIPPEEHRSQKHIHVRRVWNAKSHDVGRRSQRDAKASRVDIME